jgi:hypothetical protein
MYITTCYDLYSICIGSTKYFTLIPLMCTHVYAYVLRKVHPQSIKVPLGFSPNQSAKLSPK